jgi:hypothetical protein
VVGRLAIAITPSQRTTAGGDGTARGHGGQDAQSVVKHTTGILREMESKQGGRAYVVRGGLRRPE